MVSRGVSSALLEDANGGVSQPHVFGGIPEDGCHDVQKGDLVQGHSGNSLYLPEGEVNTALMPAVSEREDP